MSRIPYHLFCSRYRIWVNLCISIGVPKWKALNTKIDAAYGNNFLITVDKYIAKHGTYMRFAKVSRALRDGIWEAELAPHRNKASDQR